ncbi:hypothetical protein V1525DRAFT_384890 [Lipomyces kononenkoae]|uniref:Uncharacterized protein n=1 Tax=Lipomyces kononenkoae TaxID=34357 RepID=A0ACC3TAK9_LIPKO
MAIRFGGGFVRKFKITGSAGRLNASGEFEATLRFFGATFEGHQEESSITDLLSFLGERLVG